MDILVLLTNLPVVNPNNSSASRLVLVAIAQLTVLVCPWAGLVFFLLDFFNEPHLLCGSWCVLIVSPEFVVVVCAWC
jgi:hypothetical protein